MLELGGADAFVVLADADLKKTTEWAVFCRRWNAGHWRAIQDKIANTYVFEIKI